MFLNDVLPLRPPEKATSEEYNHSEGHIAFLSFLFLVEKETHRVFLGQCCRQELEQRRASCSHTSFATSLNIVMLSEWEWKREDTAVSTGQQ